jgi:GMP synthase (glutamine-hydrolysing)
VSVLVVENAADDPLGLIGTWLNERGVTPKILRPHDGDVVPRSVPDDVDGVIALGGSMGAQEDAVAPWLGDERALLADAVARDIPILGVCLGAQLLAVATDGQVNRTPNPEFGVVRVRRTAAGVADPVTGALSADVVLAAQSHRDHVAALPSNATVLLANDACAVQAFRLGRSAYGLQMHPEVDEATFNVWVDHDAPDITKAGLPPAEVRAQMAAAADELQETWRPVIHAWCDILGPHRE